MGRRERPVMPGPLYEFATDLRRLRDKTGLTYRALARAATYSYSALAAAASGDKLPTWEVTRAYVAACGGDVPDWERRWRQLAADLRATHPGLLPEPPSGQPAERDDTGDHQAGQHIPAPAAETAQIPAPSEDDPAQAAEETRLPTGVTPLAADDPRRVGPIAVAAVLGAGAMGQVFLGRTAEGTAVAVKVVHAERTADTTFRRRFRRESHALREVDSPYVASWVDGDADARRPWLATAHVPAVSLATVVDRHGPLPAPVVTRLATGLTKALAVVHAAGIVHRDLKPSNVLLTADGVQVIDFGIAAAAEGTALTATGTHLGSAAYMAPEQARGGPVGSAADVFALGSLLGYALTGVPPFGEGRLEGVLYRILHEPPDLSGVEAVTGADNNLAALIRACLDKDPDARPGAARLLAEFGLAEALPGPGWLPDAVGQDIAAHAAAVGTALSGLATTRVTTADPTEDTGRVDAGQTARAARPPRVDPVAPVVPPRTMRRAAVVVGLGALVLVVLATVLVVWRGGDNPARTAAGTRTPAVTGSTATGSRPATTASSAPASGTPTGLGSGPATGTTGPGRQSSAAPPGTVVVLAPQQQQQVPPGPTFSAMIGEGCPQNSATEQVSDSGSSAWNRHTGADGCGGRFYAAASVSGNNSFSWSFTTGPVDTGLCDVRVYVPAGGSLASANPARYKVYTGPAGTYVMSFTVDQHDNQGTWVAIGAVPVSGDSVQIRLTADGSGSGSMAAGAISITCHT